MADLTDVNGGSSVVANLNEAYNAGDIAWILVASALVWIMIPAIGFFYAGLSRRHHSLSLIWQAICAVSVVSFQWWLWGYSLAFSHTAGKYIGNLDNVILRDTLAAESVGSPYIPDILYMLYQSTFAIATGVLMVGAAMERGRLLPSMLFLFVWTTIVYDPIACWTWNANGWIFKLGGYDFAGGGPVHITSGAGALAYSVFLGKRKGEGYHTRMPHYEAGSTLLVVFGTILLWFGWFGFNGGSALGANVRAVYAAANTNLAAACGAFTWMIIDFFKQGKKKFSMISLCSGAIAGLVGITPAAGFVPIWAAVPIGILTACASNAAMNVKHLMRVDDGLDVFSLHGIGGFTGSILTGVFAADYIIPLDGFSSGAGGWVSRNWIQVAYQLAGSSAIMAYSFIVSSVILLIMSKIPGLHLRLKEDEEALGVDNVEIGEEAWPSMESTIHGQMAGLMPEKPSHEKETSSSSQQAAWAV